MTSQFVWKRNSVGTSIRVLERSAAERTGLPAATFRLQFGPALSFAAARALVPFLHRLGVSDLYASPIFKARKGSPHGYDVTNPLCLNPDLGTERDFDLMAADLKRHGIGLILDIVPNHMAVSEENPWWFDVLEEGPESAYAHYFDIDWNSSTPGCERKVLLPVLGRPYHESLENRELQIGLDAAGLFVRYWEHRLPLSLASYRTVLGEAFDSGRLAAGETPKQAVKAKLWKLYNSQPELRAYLDARVRTFNGECGEARSFEPLDRLLGQQSYRLVYWRAGREDINYRRFFDINELIGVRVEDADVFRATHSLLLRLIREGKVTGVRVDHVDGLRDPLGYLRTLDHCVRGGGTREGGKLYTVVEKILLQGEMLPMEWPVCGTTGYDFLDVANALFVDAANLERLDRIYAEFTGIESTFSELVREQKKRVLDQLFPGELRRLSARLQALAAGDRYARDRPLEEFRLALREATACLSVYRTYVRSSEISACDQARIEEAIQSAGLGNPAIQGPVLEFLRRVLLLRFPDWFAAEERRQWIEFVMTWQQLTGPVMAKGMEDTACYIYNRLVSLNVVGGGLQPVSTEAFHQFNLARRESCPFAMNASSTHDTKRSEDVRARISVLSELPEFWEACLKRWSRWNQSRKRLVHGTPAPDANEEVLIYQVLLGAWPFEEAELESFKDRMKAYLVKAAREAKVHTNWLSPDAEYEEALLAFLEGILAATNRNRFLPDFLHVQRSLAPFGALGSLAQVLLKIASPGVPDFYQGTLLWDFSLVDPDNRRPVDFLKHIKLLEELKEFEGEDPIPLVESVADNWEDGRIKLYLISKALQFRSRHRDLFASGEYIPLAASGGGRNHVVAFARRKGERWVVVAAPRLFTGLCGNRNPFAAADAWRDTVIELPADAPTRWTNVITGEEADRLALAGVLRHFPVAMLSGVEG